MASTIGIFRIDGVETSPPVENQELTIEAFFGSDNIQPKVTPLKLTLVNEAAKSVNDYIDDGNIFKGLCWSADIVGDAGTINAVDGFLDLANTYEKISPVKVLTEAKFLNGITNIDEQLQGITFDLLVAEGDIVAADYVDVQYLVEKKFDGVEVVVTSITIFLMVKELAENTEKLGNDISVFIGMVSIPPTGSVGAIIYQIAIILVRAAYILILLKSIIDLIEIILANFISLTYVKKGITYRTALEKIFASLGYTFESPISDLDCFTYLPSNNNLPSNRAFNRGIPNVQDFGYNVDAFVSLLMKQFRARIAEVDGVIHFRSLNDPYWIKTAGYVMDDVLLEDNYSLQKNSKELIKSRIIEYLLDSQDIWTIDNYKGTNYLISTQHIGEIDPRKDALKNFVRTTFPVALGNRKDSLSNLEKIIKVLAAGADTLTGIFGANQNFAQRIKNRVGMLKVGKETWSNPKMIYLKGGKMPVNHRDLTSAKYLWDNYLNYDSFVLNDFKRQRVFYEGVEVGFGLSDYFMTNSNSYFTTPSGKIGKFVNIKWNFNKDRAIVDFWVEDSKPSKKIKEIYTENE